MTSPLRVAATNDTLQPIASARGPIEVFVGDPDSEAVLRQALEERLEAPEAIHRGDIRTAMEALKHRRSPAVLIVDISGVALPVTEVNRLAEVCEPGVHVIAVGDRNDIGLYRDLVRAGVSDYIVKPLTRELVQRSVEIATGEVSANRISQKLGKLVAIMGTRGGVGVTTVAVNLAWYLANRQGRRVALLDLDLQTGDCGMMLDIKASAGLREALENPHRIDDRLLERTMVPCGGSQLFLLSAEESLRDEIRFDPTGAEALIASLQSQFHYVIVDMPRTPSAVAQRVIDLAALRVVVADETIRSAREIVRLRSVLGAAEPGRNNLLVVNKSGEKIPGFIPGKEFIGAVEMQPVATIPFQSMGHGKPATYGEPAVSGRGRLTDAITALAAEVSGRSAEKNTWRFWR